LPATWTGPSGRRDRDAVLDRPAGHCIDDAVDDLHEVDTLVRLDGRLHVQTGQRKQVVDKPRHARRLILHDLQENVPRCGVVARGPASFIRSPRFRLASSDSTNIDGV